jgi:type VI protein secretion system component VasK
MTTIFFQQVNVLLACLSMTGLAIGTWAIFWILARLIARRPAKQPAPAKIVVPAGPRGSSGEDGFTLEFSALVAEANRRLRRSPPSMQNESGADGGHSPLYLVLGAEGSGKTTAIVNSGIEPRLAGEAQGNGLFLPQPPSSGMPTAQCSLRSRAGCSCRSPRDGRKPSRS